MATRVKVGKGKIQLAAFDGPFQKTLNTDAKKSHRCLLQKLSYSQFCPKFRCHDNGGWSGENAVGSIRWPIPEPPSPYTHKISPKSFTQAEL